MIDYRFQLLYRKDLSIYFKSIINKEELVALLFLQYCYISELVKIFYTWHDIFCTWQMVLEVRENIY